MRQTGTTRWHLASALTILAAVAVVATIHVVFWVAPVEKQMGIVQKIFYFHVPSAIAMYVGAAACFVGSTAYLVRSTVYRDALGRAGAEVVVIFGLMVLTTGPLWASQAWGKYWTWDPKLTTTLLSFLVYVGYLLFRSFAGSGPAVQRFSAAVGFLGALTMPVIFLSVRKLHGQHPQVITGGGGGLGSPLMWWALRLGMVTFVLLALVMVWLRTSIAVAESRMRKLELQASGLDDEEGDDDLDR